MKPLAPPRLLLAGACAAIALAACGSPQPEPAAPQSGKSLPSVVVGAATAAAERIHDGRVEGIDQTTVRAQTSGRIAAIVHDVNDRVAAGAVVMRLRGVEQRAGLAQAQSGLVEAQARESEAQQRFQRIADLYERKVVAKSSYDEALAARDAAVARVAAARAGLDSARESVAYADLAAPFAGVVAARHVQPGDVIAPGQPLFDVVAPDRLRVILDVPQRVAESLRGSAAAFVLRDQERVAASAVHVFTAADSAAGTVRIWADLPREATGFFAGQFVRVALPGTAAAELRVPAAALVERSEVTAVYVVAEGGALSLRQVRVGRRDGGSVEILAGLSAGERVVTEPLAALRLLEGKTTQ
jgi:RND family efflux transporter MFP subunit